MSLFDPNLVDAIALFTLLILMCGACFLGLILSSRIVLTQPEDKLEWLREQLQNKINALILSENERVPQRPFQWQIHLRELRLLLDNSKHQQLMIDLLVMNKQNFTGRSSVALRKIYLRLGLKRLSRQKLSHTNYQVNMQGLQELAEMGCADVSYVKEETTVE